MPNFVIHKNLIPVGNTDTSSFTRKIRPLSDENMEDLFVHLSAHDFSGIANCNDVNAAVVDLSDIIVNYFNVFCPIKTKIISYKSKIKPWITSSILGDIKKRQSFYLLYRQGKMRRETFNRFRNYVTLRIRNAKKSYYERKFDECRRDIKGTWDLINRIVRPGNFHRSNFISELTVGDNTLNL